MQTAPEGPPAKVAERYAILGVVGSGGMAKVFRARDESLGRTIALKRLTSSDASAAALFEAEFHTLAGLRHASIVEVFDFGVDDEGPYYTMELLEGQDVAALAPLPWQLVCECLRDIGGALALVHRREFVHRDISPRNIWRTANGTFKVLDFGALTRFGVPNGIVGTPAFMAPESVMGEALDQRADLYSLGAVAYFLLTGRRVNSVRTMGDLLLPQPKPPPPSSLVAPAAGTIANAIPPELDELVLSLLNRTPLARPSSAAEVIERASAIAGLTSVAHSRSSHPQLVSTEFVGRGSERAALREAISKLRHGTGSAILVEGQPGIGKSRLLQETKLEAGVTGMTVLAVEARLHPAFHGAAVHLAKSLLEALPEVARRVAAPHVDVIGGLSAELRDKLGYSGPKATFADAPGEMRMRIQTALSSWFKTVSERQKLALFIDDADDLDEASAAFVAALARSSREAPLLVLASCTHGRDMAEPVKVLRAAVRRLRIKPLDLAETQSMLRSAFGDALNLPRLADKLHEFSAGNPRRCMDLVQHLVRQDVISHQGGVWILPQELRDEQLPGSDDSVLAQHIERLSETARTVARLLALEGGVLSVDMLCSLLDDERPGRVSMAVDELLREGIASGARSACRLVARYAAHTGTLDAARQEKLHRKVGEAILAKPELSALNKLDAGLHLLRGGDTARGGDLVTQGGIGIFSEAENHAAAIPVLEGTLQLYKAQNRPPLELAPILGPLSMAAFYADHRLAGKYGDETLRVFQEILGLGVAARLRRFVGKKLSVYIGLALAAVRLRRAARWRRVLTLREAFLMFFGAVATLTGVATVCIDRARALRYTTVLEPLTALGKDHVASFIFEYTRCLVTTIERASGEARARWRRMIDRLRSGASVRGLPQNRRQLYVCGALYACGVIESWRDEPEALRIAEELQATKMELYAMSADQLRTMYYANQGLLERFQHYRERVETHAIQRGTAWQVEIWWHGALIATHLRAHDAMGMKHTRDVLERLTKDIPSLALYAQRARGAYAVMRGRLEEGIAVLEASQRGDSSEVVGFQRTQGMLARAYNLAGKPDKAKALCLSALATMDDGDRELVAMNLIVLTELALAEARLGNFTEAEKQLDALLAKHLPFEGPLTLGALFEARATVAMLKTERETARTYFQQMASWYDKTALPSLAARSESLLSSLERQANAYGRDAPADVADDTSETVILTDDA
ncbi:MAG TPA: AAA family ATPase [Polyangiaceae bacterium]|nr:AAA family ATPase [Polyangiaceae bacterium]